MEFLYIKIKIMYELLRLIGPRPLPLSFFVGDLHRVDKIKVDEVLCD